MNDDFGVRLAAAAHAVGMRDVKWGVLLPIPFLEPGQCFAEGFLSPTADARCYSDPTLRASLWTGTRGGPQWVSLLHLGQAWVRRGNLCVDLESSILHVLRLAARDSHAFDRRRTFRRAVANALWTKRAPNFLLQHVWARIDKEAHEWARPMEEVQS